MKHSVKIIAVSVGLIALAVLSGRAQTVYYWDSAGTATTTTSRANGSGTWSTGAANWIGVSNSSDQVWTNSTTSATVSAIFGTDNTTSGTYVITLPGTVTASTLTFNTSGYKLTGGTLRLLFDGGTNNFSNGASLTVSSGVSAEINSALSGNNMAISVGTGGTLTLSGGTTSLNQIGFIGGGTVYLTGGAFSTSLQIGTNVVQGAVTVTASTFIMGPSTTGAASNPTYTMNDSAAVLVASGGLQIGRNSKAGLFDLAAGTVTTSYVNLNVDYATSGYLKVEGGSMNITSGTGLMIGGSGTKSGTVGTVTQSGGVINTPLILFGNSTGSYASDTTGSLLISGGTAYVGSGGIRQGAYSQGTTKIVLSGGALAASADWSSGMNMTLGTVSGNIATFQAADSSGTAHNITIGGVLSGVGGLNKTGTGKLVLNGNNTYTGGTSVTAGTLVLGSGSAVTPTGTPLAMATGVTTFASGASTITLNNVSGVAVGQAISGTGIAAGTTITAINGNVITLSANTTAANSGNYTIYTLGTVAPTATAASGATSVTLGAANVTGLSVGMLITGTNIAAGTYITSIDAGTGAVGLSQATTGSVTAGTGYLTFGGINQVSVASTTGIAVGQGASGSGAGVVQSISTGKILTLTGTNSSLTSGTSTFAAYQGTLGSGSVTVASGAKLGGVGKINPTGTNAMTVSGALAPDIGGATGTLILDKTGNAATTLLTLNAGATLEFNLSASNTSSQLALTNAATGEVSFSNNVINFTDLTAGSLSLGTYLLISSDAANAFLNLTVDGNNVITSGLSIGTGLEAYSSDTLQLVQSGNNIYLSITSVPEPSVLALLWVGLGLAGVSQRRRRMTV